MSDQQVPPANDGSGNDQAPDTTQTPAAASQSWPGVPALGSEQDAAPTPYPAPSTAATDQPAQPTAPPPYGQPTPPQPPYGTPAPPQPPYGTPAPPQPPYGTPAPPQPQYGAPQYGGPQYGAPLLPKHTNATTAMVLGIVALAGFFCCGLSLLLGPVAWILGQRCLKDIEQNPGMYSGQSEARTGMILGIIATVCLVLWVLAVAAYFIFAFAVVGGSTYGSDLSLSGF